MAIDVLANGCDILASARVGLTGIFDFTLSDLDFSPAATITGVSLLDVVNLDPSSVLSMAFTDDTVNLETGAIERLARGDIEPVRRLSFGIETSPVSAVRSTGCRD